MSNQYRCYFDTALFTMTVEADNNEQAKERFIARIKAIPSENFPTLVVLSVEDNKEIRDTIQYEEVEIVLRKKTKNREE